MFNKKLKEELAFQGELMYAILDHLNLDVDFCEDCGSVILVPNPKSNAKK